jgi:hypothetical protein
LIAAKGGGVSSKISAAVFAGLLCVVVAFQLALALGAPWGAYAMGGGFPGAFPPPLRAAAVVQAGLLVLTGLVVLAKAGLVLPAWRPASRRLVWVVVGLFAVSVVLNLATPSAGERLLWAPIAGVLFLASLHVALAR